MKKTFLGSALAAFAGAPLPAHTFLAISQLARPGMQVEMDVIAVAPK